MALIIIKSQTLNSKLKYLVFFPWQFHFKFDFMPFKSNFNKESKGKLKKNKVKISFQLTIKKHTFQAFITRLHKVNFWTGWIFDIRLNLSTLDIKKPVIKFNHEQRKQAFVILYICLSKTQQTVCQSGNLHFTMTIFQMHLKWGQFLKKSMK